MDVTQCLHLRARSPTDGGMRRFPISVKLAAGFGIMILLLIVGALLA
jgi:hypothetical protein